MSPEYHKLEIHIKYGGEWLLAIGADNVTDAYLDVAIDRLTDQLTAELKKVMKGEKYTGRTAKFDKDGVIDTDSK
jgi:hypothetical protein